MKEESFVKILTYHHFNSNKLKRNNGKKNKYLDIMAPAGHKKLKKKSLANQVKSVIKERRFSSSSSETEMSVVQLRKKIKELKQIKSEEEQPSSSGKKEFEEMVLIERMEQQIERRREQIEIRENQIVQYASKTPLNYEAEIEQMFGKDYEGDTMVLLIHNVYCRKKILNMALCSSHRASHLARKLLEGVFKPETLLNCTLTGMPARAQGKERQERNVVGLDINGRTAIIDFSIDTAEKRGWTSQTKEFIRRQMSQRIGELKRNEGEKSLV